jgi:hypothetical protein
MDVTIGHRKTRSRSPLGYTRSDSYHLDNDCHLRSISESNGTESVRKKMKNCTQSAVELNQKILSFSSILEASSFFSHHVAHFNAVNVATAVHRLAKIYRIDGLKKICGQTFLLKKVLRVLETQAVKIAPTFKPRELANLMWAMAVLNHTPTLELQNLISKQALCTIRSFKPQDISNLAWAMATLGIRPSPQLFIALSEKAIEILSQFKPQEISNLLWSMATLHFCPSNKIVNDISTHTLLIIPQFKSQELSNFLWSMTTLNLVPSKLLVETMCRHAESIYDDFEPQGVANILCSLAKLDLIPSRSFCMVIFNRAGVISERFKPAEIANLMWALAKLEIAPSHELLQALLKQAVAIAEQFLPLDITNLIWALASLRITPPYVLVEAMSLRATAIASQFSPHELSLLFWGVSTMEMGQDILKKMKHCIITMINQFNAHDVSNAVWALAKSGVESGLQLHFCMSRHALNIAHQFNPQEISALMWALAKNSIFPDEGLLNAMMARAFTLSEQFGPQEVANMLWALATLDIEPTVHFVGAMLSRAVGIVRSFKVQEICNLLWALACLGLQHKVQFSAVLDVNCLLSLAAYCASMEQLSQVIMPKESLRQIHQVIISSRLDGFFPGLHLQRLLSADCTGLCKYTFETSDLGKSMLQSSVSLCLASFDVFFVEEFLEPCTGYSIDIMLFNEKNEPYLALEVDGPSHFFSLPNGNWRPKGATRWKRRLLASAGILPVCVPFWEWSKCTNASEQKSYLLQLLHTVDPRFDRCENASHPAFQAPKTHLLQPSTRRHRLN